MTRSDFDDLFPSQPSSEREPRRREQVRMDDAPRRARPVQPRPSSRASSPSRGAASSYQNRDRYRTAQPRGRVQAQPRRNGRRALPVVIGLLAIVVLAGGAFAFAQSMPASITLNGTSLDVGGDKTIAEALHATGIKPNPGDLVAIDGSVLEEGKGEPFHATVNGEAVNDLETKLASGDVVEVGDGKPIEEPSETVEETLPHVFEEVGNGPIHLVESEGADGLKHIKTGTMSGLTTEEVVQEPVNVTRRNVSPEVGDDKVIALTFDDGPWPETTAAVLDVLAEHGAKATFFTVGNRIEGEGIELVKRAAAEGHQICTHSFSHAAGDGQSVNLGYMKPEDQIAEIEKGYAAIEAATGGEASRVFRAPGGNFGEDVMRNVGPLISSEIGWNIDSQDWRKPGAGPIADQIKNAWSGSVVLMHDGGGDRTQTVEALKDALPYLKSQGYRFVTMDELLSYPLA